MTQYVLRGARLIDGTGRDPVDDAAVVVADDRITAVSPSAPASGTDVDLSGLTLLPGLIDAHTHLGWVTAFTDDMRTAPAVVAGRIFENCSLALDAGFTSCRDCGGVDGGLAQAIEQGIVRGPRLFPSGPILCQCGGHGDACTPWLNHGFGQGIPGLVQLSLVCDGPDEVRKGARIAFKRGATQIKVCVTGGVVSLTDSLDDTQFTVEELRAAVTEAEARDTYVTAHTHNVRGIRNGLAAGVACFEHATFLDEATVEAMAKAGVATVPTLTVTRVLAEEWEAWQLPPQVVPRLGGVEEAMKRSIKMTHAAGITVGSGSDLLGAGQNRRGLELVLKAEVLGPMEAIVSATSTNAKILRRSEDLGTVAEGKLADLIAVDFDPLQNPKKFDDPSAVVFVMKGGEIVKDTRASHA